MTSHPSTSFQVPADPASAAAAAPTQTSTSTSAGPQSEGSRSSSSAEHSKEQEQDHDQVWSSESSMSYAGTPPTSVDLGIKSRLPTEVRPLSYLVTTSRIFMVLRSNRSLYQPQHIWDHLTSSAQPRYARPGAAPCVLLPICGPPALSLWTLIMLSIASKLGVTARTGLCGTSTLSCLPVPPVIPWTGLCAACLTFEAPCCILTGVLR